MPSPVYDTTHPVLVTGATGFVAGWLVKRLLSEGFTVHAAVRDPDHAEKVAHLTALPGTLKLFKADLLQPGSYAEAMAGCQVVFHTASPFTLAVRDAQRDLVDPAVNGTRNVLEQADATSSVKRVVLTSSCAAITGDHADLSALPGGVMTEAHWNTSSSLTHQPYPFSKTQAEGVAWDIAGAQDRWDLVVINPSLVVGPGVSTHQTSESFNLMRQMGDGSMKSGVPPYEIGMVDVRDVAEAHMRAGFIAQAEGRHILSAGSYSMLDAAEMLRPEFGETLALPSKELPKWLIWLVGPIMDKTLTRKMISRSFGLPWKDNNSKSKQALGLQYHPVPEAVNAMMRQMIESGRIKP